MKAESISTVTGSKSGVDVECVGEEATEREINRLHSLGEDAEVHNADGAMWLYKVNGRSIKFRGAMGTNRQQSSRAK